MLHRYLGNRIKPSTLKQKDVQYCDMDSDCVKTTHTGCDKLKTKNKSNNARSMVDKLGVQIKKKTICIFLPVYNTGKSKISNNFYFFVF